MLRWGSRGLVAVTALAGVGVVLSGPAAWADSPSDPRASFVAGNVTTCGGVGLGSDTQLGSDSNNSASDNNVSGVVKTNAGSVQPGQGQEVDVSLTNPNVVIDVAMVKGGNGYNLYTNGTYLPPALGPDQHYISPLNNGGNVPTISHWFVCYHTIASPALSIVKTADAPSVSAGSQIGFTVTVSNSQADGTATAKSVSLADPLPAGPTGSGVSWSIDPAYTGPGSCQIDSTTPPQTLSCSFGDMTPGASASVHITSATTSASVGTYVNTATATATNSTPVQATAQTQVLAPGLSIVKTADAPSVKAGDPIGFTVTVSNSSADGTGTATAVTLSDPLPAGPTSSGIKWSIIPAYSGPGTCQITGTAPVQTLSCQLGDMLPGASASVHVRSATTAASVGTYLNTATATATNVPAPVKATATTKVLAVTLKIFFGYADGLRSGSDSTPGRPWEGSADTNFIGCPKDACPNGQGRYDGGAVLIENGSDAPITFSGGFVVIGHCTFTPWGNGMTIPAANGSTLGALVLTQTLKGLKPQGNQAGCPLVTGPTINDNFDTSETDPLTCSLQTHNDGLIPKVTFTINGQTLNLSDTKQVLNTGGRDRGCGGKTVETTPWSLQATITLSAPK
jgi:uncharacterized repeat protein (TIGR01451 family)